MTDTLFEELLDQRRFLLADGAIGTNLFDLGLVSGEAPELWNDEQPERVRQLHRNFVEVGSDLILTNTFGCNSLRLKLHNAEKRVQELNEMGAQLARQAAEQAGTDRKIVIAGSIGPTGELFEPLGTLSYESAVLSFAEQIEGLKTGGVDILWIETMSAPEEIKAAAEAATNSGLPYSITASFDTAGNTMMGLSPNGLGDLVAEFANKPVAFGSNCGVGAPDLLAALLNLTDSHPDSVIIAKANCGIPKIQGKDVVYTGTPELMAKYTQLALDAGVRIVGGCCGTTIEHLAAMRAVMDNYEPKARPSIEDITENLGPLVSAPKQGRNDESNLREIRRRSRRRNLK